MAAVKLPEGTTLYLRPEDVQQDVNEAFYATVVSASDVEVVFEPLGGGGDIANESIPIALAVTRVVPDEEPTGSRSSALIRQGVACLHNGDVLFGQVVATSDIAVQVAFACGHRWILRQDVLATVSPLLTMLLFELALGPARWTGDHVRDVDTRLAKCLEDAMNCPAMEEVMDVVDKLSAMTPKGGLREWRDMKTGRVRPTSTDHALLYSYYVEGARLIPPLVQPLIGDSIAADPARLDPGLSAVTRASTKRPRAPSGFAASETSFDNPEDEEKGEEPAGFSYVAAVADATGGGTSGTVSTGLRASRMRASNAPVDRPPTSRMRATPPPAPALEPRTSAQAMAVLQTRLADSPDLIHLLRLALRSDDETGKGRSMFKPIGQERETHDEMSAPEYQGMLPHAFLLSLVASVAVQFYPYPAVLMLLYRFWFGPGGLSIMHLVKMSLLDRMALQEKNSVSTQDYGATATLPDPRRPDSWSDVQDAVNGLVTYCNVYSDPLTRRVVATLAGFVSALQAYDNWPETHLNVLVFWINERLYAYRGLVHQRLHEGSGDPSVALTWFSPSNPDLAPVRSTVFHLEMAALHQAARAAPVHSNLPQRQAQVPAAAAQRGGIPANVLAAIPKKDGNELCLKFASAVGCKTEGKTCSYNGRIRGHFVDKKLPPVVRQYLISRFGGVAACFSGSA